MVEVKVHGCIVGPTSYPTRIPFIPCQSAIPFLRYGYLTLKIQVQCHGKVKGQGHIVGSTTYQLTSLSFHVDRPSHSWDMAISKFDLESPRSKSGQRLRSHSGSNILSTHIPFIRCQSTLPFLRYNFFKLWPWKSKVKIMVRWNIKVKQLAQHPFDVFPFCFTSILWYVQYSAVPLWRGQFSLKFSQQTPHSSLVRARYGVSVVILISDTLSVTLIAVSYVTW